MIRIISQLCHKPADMATPAHNIKFLSGISRLNYFMLLPTNFCIGLPFKTLSTKEPFS
jgi:hypothetical protein